MASVNFELYELLKGDVKDEAARMIAELVPAAGDLATKADVERNVAELKAYIDSRLLRFTAVILVPMVVAMLAAVGTMIGVLVSL